MIRPCPECDAELTVPDDAMVGEVVSCPDCGESWELATHSSGLLGFKKAEKQGEDWGQ